ncbi:hypothetical protein OG599_07900 [Streptomyces sp. NBC_01335]|uniref:hypothetical protein n=1 Tax=Streptomyces sp. NBC_01335 TaxID=2903828 RepID=UPI002E1095CD|nr:hypothetical protein OG599_07900 [Streptomyces sp. NBC_01335]
MDISRTHLRTARAALFTALVVTLSSASHVLLSREALPVAALALVAGLVFAAAYALAGRERGFGAIAGLLVPLELAADTVFTTGQQLCYGAAGGPVAGPLRSLGFDVLCGGHGVGAPLARVAGVGRPAAASVLELPLSPGPTVPWLLLAAHVTVGLLAAAWLRRGESALAALLRAAAAFAFRPLLVAAAVAGASRRPAREAVRPVGRRPPVAARPLFTHSVGRRGPPLPV